MFKNFGLFRKKGNTASKKTKCLFFLHTFGKKSAFCVKKIDTLLPLFPPRGNH